MSQVTTTTTTPPVTVVCAGTLTVAATVVIASISLGFPGVPDQQCELPVPPSLILVGTTKDVAGFTAVLL